MKKVAIVGGGLAGLITSIQLVRAGIPVQLFERKRYPFHRVCGEYISNETAPFLRSLHLFPEEFNPPEIKRLQLTSVNGRAAEIPLDLGGFGISRFAYDHWLSKTANHEGVEIMEETEINKISFTDDFFQLTSPSQLFNADVVVGAFGKRSKLDKSLGRLFLKKRSPFVGVKYHIRIDHPGHTISLHNFKDGYCGMSAVENGVTNLCYLTERKNLKNSGGVRELEESVLFENPFLERIFKNADFAFDAPEVINEISFETKKPVEHHILMAGDAAGMITPLCGNGMAMAIHSSKILAQLLVPYCAGAITRKALENAYAKSWTKQFALRLWTGRQLQKLFGAEWSSNFAVNLARYATPIANYLVSKTHGHPF